MEKKVIQGFRLSPQQEHLWSSQQDEAGGDYRVACLVSIEGQLDPRILKKALQHVVERHEILRTTLHCSPEMTLPIQVINENDGFSMQEFDVGDLEPPKQEFEINRIIDEANQETFDLQQTPILHASLITRSPFESILHLGLPALCGDPETLINLVREAGLAYDACLRGEELPGEPLQYADLAEWLNELLESEEAEAGKERWRLQQLTSAGALRLPFEIRPEIAAPFAPKTFAIKLDPAVAERVMAACRDLLSTERAFLLACWQSLLWRLSGEAEFVVGAACNGRAHEELKDALGPLTKYLPVTGLFEEGTRFDEILSECDKSLQNASKAQNYFSWQPDELGQLVSAGAPVFPYCFEFVEAAPFAETRGLRFSLTRLATCPERFTLKLDALADAESLSLQLQYDPTYLTRGQVERMGAQLRTLLADACEHPRALVGELQLLDQADWRQQVLEWEEKARMYPRLRLHEMFEQQAAETPDRVALVSEELAVTYAELNRGAARVAERLRRLGVGPEVVVAVYLERSVAQVEALLGVLKAGGAYLPLERAYPRERLRFMLADAAVAVIVTQAELVAELPESGALVVCLGAEEEHSDVVRSASGWAAGAEGAETLAYVIYTSGSTGEPKGAMLPHAGVVNCVQWMQETYQLQESDRFLFKTPLGFDPSVWEVFWTLGVGATVVVTRAGGEMDSGYLAEVIKQEQVTSVYFVPGMLGAYLEERGAGWGQLRRVICGGEALPAAVLERFYEVSGSAVELHHSYGPTEVSIAATEWVCERGASVQMGCGLANTRVYVLDGRGRAVGEGVAGELYLGGAGVGRGYLNRPGQTGERFVPDPFAGAAGARMYRTGDVVRRVEGGGVEFVGRVDHQVKVRGRRIELGEVEAALRSYAGVREAVVEVRADERGEQRLVGYVVWQAAKAEPGVGELRRYLRERLPEYMVPAALVVLAELPLMANGKVNRRNLPTPDWTQRSEFDEAYAAPRSVVEEALVQIWAEVLGAARVGIHDNYFALGGDSIKAVRVVALAKKSGFEISLQQLFQHQTIYELAHELKITEASFAPLVKTEPFSLVSEEDRAKLPEDVEDAYPLAMLQAGMLYQIELMAGTPVYHGVNSWPLRAPMNPEVFQQAVNRVVVRHAVLRTSFDLTTYSEPLQLVHKTAHLPVYVADLRELPTSEQEDVVAAFIENEKKRAFDLSRPPLLRLHLHLLSDETFHFGLTECHPILDGWSLTSTLAEIFKYYFAALNNEDLPVEPPPASTYRDFIHLERLSLNSDECRNYWEQKLADCTVTKVPRWPATQKPDDGRRVRQPVVEISPETNEGLGRLARLAGTPLKSVALAAHLRIMALITGQTDLLTGVTSNGRLEEIDGEQVRGLFLNSVPFRLKLGGGTWVDLVRETFKAELELLPHRRYPLAALHKNWNKSSLFETLFNFVHFHAMGDVFRSGQLERIAGRSFGSEENSFTISAGFSLSPVTSHLTLLLDCDATELSEEQIRRLGEYYTRVLRVMAADPFGRYESQQLLNPEEYRQLLTEWNGAEPTYATDLCLHELFEAQVKRTPDAIALVLDDEQLTYDELNRRANRAARRLRGLGVGAESLVGLCLERGLDVVVGILAILKAGGAYVPLDPAYPPERLALLIEDAAVSVLLTQKGLSPLEMAETRAHIVYMDSESGDVSDDEHLWSEARSDNLAYVIYTSGSMGKPKGVLVSHANVTRLFDATHDQFHFDSGDVWTLFHSYAFDFSVWEIWGPLLSGGRLVILPAGLSRAPEDFYELMRREQVTVLNQTPSAFRQLMLIEESLPVARDLPLRLVIFGGEALDLQSLRPWFERHGDQSPRLVNMYGITETTVHVTYRSLATEDLETAPGSVIGGAISDLRVYILDQHLGLTPVAAPGEMHVGGDGVARGYLGSPELTALRFIPDPFSQTPGARLYRSGDSGRYLLDGDIEYLGRIDNQVKIRGFRIELGEIEAVLGTHPWVRENVALVFDDESGQKRLVSYVVLHEDDAGPTSQLRSFLKERLPEFMVPSVFVTLDALPLTPNGKLDRRALPAPQTRQQLEETYIAPRTDAERIIATIWQDLLHVDRVGMDDNFFDLGGDSILLVRTQSLLRQAFGQELSMVDMFRYPSISSLTKHLNQKTNGKDSVESSDTQLSKLPEGKKRMLRLKQVKREAEASRGLGHEQ